MESQEGFEDDETPAVGAGDVEEGKDPETAADGEGIVDGGEGGETGEGAEEGETGEAAGTEEVGGEHAEGEGVEGEHIEGEHVEGAGLLGEHVEGEGVEGEHVEGEGLEGEHVEGEGVEGEQVEGEEHKKPENELLPPVPDEVVEEEGYPPEPPPDPTAPYDLSDSKERLLPPFQLRPDQLAEVEQLWELFQNYTPAYSDLDGYITETEAVYMLKSLLLMTYTEEQFQELIAFCCRPPDPKGHILYDQFLKMVTIRQRNFETEDELRSALQVFDPEKTGSLDREEFREVLLKGGHKMAQKLVDNLMKEVDMSNDGTIGVEDVVGTMCIDLNPEDMQLLRDQVYPPETVVEEDDL